MARRRAWDALAPGYRRRLEAGGVTRSRYEAGASLAQARGHAATPERPARLRRTPSAAHPGGRTATGGALRHPDRYADYLTRHYPQLVSVGEPPALGPDWAVYRDPTLKRAVEYADAIGNPEYVHAYIQSDGSVILTVQRPKRAKRAQR